MIKIIQKYIPQIHNMHNIEKFTTTSTSDITTIRDKNDTEIHQENTQIIQNKTTTNTSDITTNTGKKYTSIRQSNTQHRKIHNNQHIRYYHHTR